MIEYFKTKDFELKQLENFERGCWINVISPTQEEIEYLCSKFKINRNNILSALDPNEVPRVEFIGKDIYVILKTISSDTGKLNSILILLSKSFILTLSSSKPQFIKEIINKKRKFDTTRKIKCFLRLFYFINKGFEEFTLNTVKAVNREKANIRKLTDKQINNLLEQEGILNDLVASYYYTNLVYEKIIKKAKFPAKEKERIEDLAIEAQQGFNLCRASLKTISNIRNTLVILASNKLNKIITLLTVFTILISIPAAVSSIYGMNILLPMQDNPKAFEYIITFIIALWAVFIVYLKRIL